MMATTKSFVITVVVSAPPGGPVSVTEYPSAAYPVLPLVPPLPPPAPPPVPPPDPASAYIPVANPLSHGNGTGHPLMDYLMGGLGYTIQSVQVDTCGASLVYTYNLVPPQ